jgi:hypothetical protein
VDTRTVIAIVAAIIGFLSLVMALGRTPPKDTKTNLLLWIEFFRFRLDSRQADVKFLQLATLISVLFFGVSVGVGVAKIGEGQAPHIPHGYKCSAVGDDEVQCLTWGGLGQPRYPGAEKQLIKLNISGFLGLSDVDRWRLSRTLRFNTINMGHGKPCEARLFEKPQDTTAKGMIAAVKEIVEAGGWHIEGGRNTKNVFPDGITINVGQESGPAYNCAYPLSELFESMRLKPVNFRPNVSTPDLVDCKDCAEIIVGASKKPDD